MTRFAATVLLDLVYKDRVTREPHDWGSLPQVVWLSHFLRILPTPPRLVKLLYSQHMLDSIAISRPDGLVGCTLAPEPFLYHAMRDGAIHECPPPGLPLGEELNQLLSTCTLV